MRTPNSNDNPQLAAAPTWPLVGLRDHPDISDHHHVRQMVAAALNSLITAPTSTPRKP